MPQEEHTLAWIDEELASLDGQGRLRRRLTHQGPSGPQLVVAGRTYVNCGTNDYLGLASDPASWTLRGHV